jgi:hypothetical protein
MVDKIKIDHCFKKLVPEALQALHEIHYMQAQEMEETSVPLRAAVRSTVTAEKSLTIDKEFLAKIMDFVGALGNYYELLQVFDNIRDAIPSEAIAFVNKSSLSDEEIKTGFEEFKKAIIFLHNAGGEEAHKEEISNALKIVCRFVANSESHLHKYSDEQ